MLDPKGTTKLPTKDTNKGTTSASVSPAKMVGSEVKESPQQPKQQIKNAENVENDVVRFFP